MVKASVMEIYDLQTSVGKGTVLKVHTPTGNNIKRHLLGHFLQYKKFKYLGAKVTLVPASTLPADPLQLSYDAGEANIDPRDMVNPILWKHYHGETMLTDVLPSDELKDYNQKTNLDTAGTNGSALEQALYGYRSSSQLDSVYPRTLMDTSFRKAGIQTGFTTFCRPFVYNVVSNVQLLPRSGKDGNANPSSFMNSSIYNNPEDAYPVFMKHSGTETEDGDMLKGPGTTHWVKGATTASNPKSQTGGNLVMTTNKLVPLGWMDTLSREGSGGTENANMALAAMPPSGNSISGDAAIGANLQNVPMLYILMPPAYKTEFYFRMIIKHYYAFSGFRSCFSVQSFPSVGLFQNIPVPDTYYSASTNALSSMVAEIESDSSVDTVDVENGVLHSMADGVEGE
uniref:Capsid protein n=1 Tax=Porcine associated porprismacovirus TaxID=2496634 RepID=A0A482JPU1_9VIRU|nr:capsid protein [Porcine associated porprismacovirus]